MSLPLVWLVGQFAHCATKEHKTTTPTTLLAGEAAEAPSKHTGTSSAQRKLSTCARIQTQYASKLVAVKDRQVREAVPTAAYTHTDTRN